MLVPAFVYSNFALTDAEHLAGGEGNNQTRWVGHQGTD